MGEGVNHIVKTGNRQQAVGNSKKRTRSNVQRRIYLKMVQFFENIFKAAHREGSKVMENDIAWSDRQEVF